MTIPAKIRHVARISAGDQFEWYVSKSTDMVSVRIYRLGAIPNRSTIFKVSGNPSHTLKTTIPNEVTKSAGDHVDMTYDDAIGDITITGFNSGVVEDTDGTDGKQEQVQQVKIDTRYRIVVPKDISKSAGYSHGDHIRFVEIEPGTRYRLDIIPDDTESDTTQVAQIESLYPGSDSLRIPIPYYILDLIRVYDPPYRRDIGMGIKDSIVQISL